MHTATHGMHCVPRGLPGLAASKQPPRTHPSIRTLHTQPSLTIARLQLLKKKADALTMRYRQILKDILEAKQNLGQTMKASFFAYTEAQYTAGENVKHTIADNVETATVKIRSELDNVAGVKIPRFKSYVIPGETKMDLAGGWCRHAWAPSAAWLQPRHNLYTHVRAHPCTRACCQAGMSLISVCTPRTRCTAMWHTGRVVRHPRGTTAWPPGPSAPRPTDTHACATLGCST